MHFHWRNFTIYLIFILVPLARAVANPDPASFGPTVNALLDKLTPDQRRQIQDAAPYLTDAERTELHRTLKSSVKAMESDRQLSIAVAPIVGINSGRATDGLIVGAAGSVLTGVAAMGVASLVGPGLTGRIVSAISRGAFRYTLPVALAGAAIGTAIAYGQEKKAAQQAAATAQGAIDQLVAKMARIQQERGAAPRGNDPLVDLPVSGP
jgi:hypothetical protein